MPVGPVTQRETQRPIVLASTSPRRKEILSLLGLPFQSVPPRFEERSDLQRSGKEEVLLFAKEKARSVEKDFSESIIIGSDTLIECGGEKIGKPRDKENAREILKFLRGKKHHIWTAVALLDTADGTSSVEAAQVNVWMEKITDSEIASYISTPEPLDKAGAYSIQGEGRRFIRRLEGDYLAAVGLPLKTIAYFLEERGVPFPLDIEKLYREKSFLNWSAF